MLQLNALLSSGFVGCERSVSRPVCFILGVVGLGGAASNVPFWIGLWLGTQPIGKGGISLPCWVTNPVSSVNLAIRSLLHTGCPRRNVPDFGRVFLMLKYTDITQNTYIQSWTVTEIMAREKCGLLAGPRTVPVSWQVLSMFIFECGVRIRKVSWHYLIVDLYQNAQSVMLRQCLHSCVMYSAWNPKDKYDMHASFFVVQFNGFMSLKI